MIRQTPATWIAIVATLSALVPRAAAGQSPESSRPARHLFEYWFGPTMVISAADGSVTADYPVDLHAGSGNGRAVQQLTLSTSPHLGVEGGFGLYPSGFFGFQFRLNYVSEDFSGTSTPYQVTLNYAAATPPDNVPVPHQFSSTTLWVPPTGTSTELTLSIDGAVRWHAGATLTGTVGGGFTYFRAKGHVESLGFGQLSLLGDGTIRQDTYAMSLSYGTSTALGFDVGGALAAKLAGPVDFLADVRYFHAADLTPAMRVSAYSNPPASSGAPPLEAVNSSMALINAHLDPSFARIFIGVRIRS